MYHTSSKDQRSIFGITGHCGAGKSVAASFFAAQGFPVVQADVITQQIYCYNENFRTGLRALHPDFSDDLHLDKPRVQQYLHEGKIYINQIEALIHPLVREYVNCYASKSLLPFIFFEIPLPQGFKHYALRKRLIVLQAPQEKRMNQLRQRRQKAYAYLSDTSYCNQELSTDVPIDYIVNNADIHALHQELAQWQSVHLPKICCI